MEGFFPMRHIVTVGIAYGYGLSMYEAVVTAVLLIFVNESPAIPGAGRAPVAGYMLRC